MFQIKAVVRFNGLLFFPFPFMDDVAAGQYYELYEIAGIARQSTARLWYFCFAEFMREIGG